MDARRLIFLLAIALICKLQFVTGITPSSTRGWQNLRVGALMSSRLTPSPRRALYVSSAALAASQLQGLARSAGFWVRAMPIWWRYRRVGWLRRSGLLSDAEADDRLEALHERAADEILAAILHLRGAYVKIGQVLSSRPDVIPGAWVEKLSKLQDDVPGRGGRVARQAIRRGLGSSKSKGLVETLVDEQIGAAATGQVHRCTVDGKDVCVKVQYPGESVRKRPEKDA